MPANVRRRVFVILSIIVVGGVYIVLKGFPLPYWGNNKDIINTANLSTNYKQYPNFRAELDWPSQEQQKMDYSRSRDESKKGPQPGDEGKDGPQPGDEQYHCEMDKRKVLTIEHSVWHRLGNTMYELSAMINIAEMNNMKPLLPETMATYLDDAFGISNHFCSAPNSEIERVYSDVIVNEEEVNGTNLSLPANVIGKNVYLKGYFQKRNVYLRRVEERVRTLFRFRPLVREAAQDFIANHSKYGHINVGIHLRGGDLEQNMKMSERIGFAVPGFDYLKKCFYFFENLYPNVHFIVTSYDKDTRWIAANLKHTNVVVNYRLHSPAVDMAILSQCDHVITTVGTFSWWAGWLCPGLVLYPSKDFETGNPDKPQGAIGIPSKVHFRVWKEMVAEQKAHSRR